MPYSDLYGCLKMVSPKPLINCNAPLELVLIDKANKTCLISLFSTRQPSFFITTEQSFLKQTIVCETFCFWFSTIKPNPLFLFCSLFLKRWGENVLWQFLFLGPFTAVFPPYNLNLLCFFPRIPYPLHIMCPVSTLLLNYALPHTYL